MRSNTANTLRVGGTRQRQAESRRVMNPQLRRTRRKQASGAATLGGDPVEEILSQYRQSAVQSDDHKCWYGGPCGSGGITAGGCYFIRQRAPPLPPNPSNRWTQVALIGSWHPLDRGVLYSATWGWSTSTLTVCNRFLFAWVTPATLGVERARRLREVLVDR